MSNEFERDRSTYEQHFEQFRSLNQTMWQIPVIAMSLTGGLWFGAAKVSDMPGFQYSLLVLAALANFGLIVVLTRLRYVMSKYLESIERFNPDAFVSARGTGMHASEVVANTFRLLLLASAIISLIGVGIVLCNGQKHETKRVLEVIELPK